MEFGPQVTRVSGGLQPPATSRDAGVTVMGVAGGEITALEFKAKQEFALFGNRIAFERGSQIWVMAPNGTGQTNLSNNGFFDKFPSWSPDRTKIAFSSRRNGNYEIFVMNADGSGATNLTNHPADDFRPSWSPDGTQIAFTSTRDGNEEIYVMNADGTAQTRLTSTRASEFSPSWSSPTYVEPPVIGAIDGYLGTMAAGFIFGQSHEDVTSLVVFDARRRSTARVTSLTPPGAGLPNVLFHVSADTLTALSFVNRVVLGQPVTKVIGPGGIVATATSAAVSFDSTDGQVAAVLPYTARAAGGAPTVTKEGSVRILEGHFQAVLDARGKNLAPQGATEVRLDGKTGRVLSVR